MLVYFEIKENGEYGIKLKYLGDNHLIFFVYRYYDENGYELLGFHTEGDFYKLYPEYAERVHDDLIKLKGVI